MEEQLFEPRTDLTVLNEAVLAIRSEIKKIIIGQDEMVKLILLRCWRRACFNRRCRA
jgi:MoxR-like ATPase